MELAEPDHQPLYDYLEQLAEQHGAECVAICRREQRTQPPASASVPYPADLDLTWRRRALYAASSKRHSRQFSLAALDAYAAANPSIDLTPRVAARVLTDALGRSVDTRSLIDHYGTPGRTPSAKSGLRRGTAPYNALVAALQPWCEHCRGTLTRARRIALKDAASTVEASE